MRVSICVCVWQYVGGVCVVWERWMCVSMCACVCEHVCSCANTVFITKTQSMNIHCCSTIH